MLNIGPFSPSMLPKSV